MQRSERDFKQKSRAGSNRSRRRVRLLQTGKSLAGGIALAVWGLAILGCGGARSARVGDGAVFTGTTLGTSGASAVTMPEYRIGVFDDLEIRTKYHESLNETAKVRPDGRITLENLGDIYVAGMTPSQLDSMITGAYAEIVHAPEVTVFVRGFAGVSIYVLGEVEKPGAIEMKPNMTALQALAAASGPVRGAKLNSVVLLRRGETGALNAARLDLSRANIANAEYQDQYLRPEDIIYVPKTVIANVNEFLSQIYDGLFPPFDIYFRALREYHRN